MGGLMTDSGAPRALALTHARIVTPEEEIEEGTVVLAGGRIIQAGANPPPPQTDALDLRGLIVAPGFIDLHVHGGGGFSLASDDPEQTRSFARWAVGTGVTSFLVTPIGRDRDDLLRQIRAARPLMKGVREGARPLGFHFEGPFLSPERLGAFRTEWLSEPSVEEFRAYLEAAGGHLRLISLAPELAGAEAVIAEAVAAGVVVGLAHSDATYEEAQRAFSLGVRHVTHCYNGMRLFHHRDPGCLAAALNSRDVTVELIADGVHVHPGAMELLLRAKGPERTVLVTDAIPLAGLADGSFDLGGEKVWVEDGVARRADGALAGSAFTMDRMVANAARWLPVGLPGAIRMATLNPALVIGVAGRKGRVAPGFDADLVVLAHDLEVEMTFIGGEQVYRRR
jgi:N-acetylglucosamine-6-phosphate deacetylase